VTGPADQDGPETPAPPRMPRWVVVSLLITGAALAAFVIVHLAGGGFGNHG
jgi:hypothetical protein